MTELRRGEFRPGVSAEREEQARFDQFMWSELGDEIKRYLEAKIPNRGNRTVASLQKHELQGIAWATICRYLTLREQRLQQLQRDYGITDDGLNYLLS